MYISAVIQMFLICAQYGQYWLHVATEHLGLMLNPSFKSMHLQYPVAKSLRTGFQSEQLFDCNELLMVSACTYFKAGDFLHNWPPPLLILPGLLVHFIFTSCGFLFTIFVQQICSNA